VPATLGDLSGFERAVVSGNKMFDMVDGGTFNADKAYKDSKLCNVLFTRELQRRLDQSGSGIKVNCFNPGLIVGESGWVVRLGSRMLCMPKSHMYCLLQGTGLFRYQNQIFTKVFDVAATNLLKVGETTHWGGGALEYMVCLYWM
jgi:protochlorophyllide reductase